MFGHSPPSPPKDEDDNGTVSLARNSTGNGNDSPSSDSASGGEKRHSMGDALPGRKSMDDAIITGDKKRRSGKAGSLLASARNSLHLPGSSSSSSASQSNSSSAGDSPDSPQNSFQKLGKQDPALVVPQGSHNNSAGESLPGSRSTFTVGVTEDRNKKCRRTMEDTHSYLYNFLPTPAPALDGPAGSAARHADTADSGSADPTDPASKVVETDNGYFAIFDGHAGTFAADWCGKKLHGILEDAVRKNPNTPIPELLDQTFTTVDQELEKLPLRNSGCTAVIAVLRWEDRIPNAHSATGSSALAPAAAAAARAASEAGGGASDSISQLGQAPPSSAASNSRASNQPAQLQQSATRQRVLYTANVGDARIILCRSGKALRLSYDHKGSDENEGKRVANAGGLILNNRVNGVLAVTRALGDSYMKDLVTGHPYTTETVIQPDTDEFIILACDGLWDVCTDQEAVDLIRHISDPQAASKVLVDHALSRFSTDNLSCMIVRFDSSALRNKIERRAEPCGVEGDPATSKPGGLSEAEAKVLEAKQKVRMEEEQAQGHAQGHAQGQGQGQGQVDGDKRLKDHQKENDKDVGPIKLEGSAQGPGAGRAPSEPETTPHDQNGASGGTGESHHAPKGLSAMVKSVIKEKEGEPGPDLPAGSLPPAAIAAAADAAPAAGPGGGGGGAAAAAAAAASQ